MTSLMPSRDDDRLSTLSPLSSLSSLSDLSHLSTLPLSTISHKVRIIRTHYDTCCIANKKQLSHIHDREKNMQWTEEERLRANNAKTLPSLEELEYEVASLLSSENSITHLQVIASAIAPEWHKIRTGAVCQDSNEFG